MLSGGCIDIVLKVKVVSQLCMCVCVEGGKVSLHRTSVVFLARVKGFYALGLRDLMAGFEYPTYIT